MNVEAVLAWPFEPYEVEVTPERAILYALSVGLGRDPLDWAELPFVYGPELKTHPLLCTALQLKGFWAQDPATGLDWRRMVLAGQGVVLHRPLPSHGRVVSQARVTGVVDKGAATGALITLEVVMREAVGGELLATLPRTILARGDGGFGGPAAPSTPESDDGPPRSPPHAVCDLATAPNQALLYRLNGDMNPLHADPGLASGAGFPRPILHGLGTLGFAGTAVLGAVCGHAPERLKALHARFRQPTFPGETLRTEIWVDGSEARFRTVAVQRNAVVLDQGRAEIAPAA